MRAGGAPTLPALGGAALAPGANPARGGPSGLSLLTRTRSRWWQPYSQQANAPKPSESYHIQVVTGAVRGAGSPSPAILQLFGKGGVCLWVGVSRSIR